MNKNSGFTLIEVLVAILILALGLLGLAALQVTSLKNNQSAYTRSQATQLAYDMADRIRANVTVPSNYIYTTTTVVTAPVGCATTVGCTAANMATNDLYEWRSNILSGLPSGLGTISSTNGIYSIIITWDDNRSNAIDSSDPSFTTSFKLQ
jgi:type IV pilus assembly protein PilV